MRSTLSTVILMLVASACRHTGSNHVTSDELAPTVFEDSISLEEIDVKAQPLLWLERKVTHASGEIVAIDGKFWKPYDPSSLLIALANSPVDPDTRANLIGATVLETDGSYAKINYLKVLPQPGYMLVSAEHMMDGHAYFYHERSPLGPFEEILTFKHGVLDGPVRKKYASYSVSYTMANDMRVGASTFKYHDGGVLNGETWYEVGQEAYVEQGTYTAPDKKTYPIKLRRIDGRWTMYTLDGTMFLGYDGVLKHAYDHSPVVSSGIDAPAVMAREDALPSAPPVDAATLEAWHNLPSAPPVDAATLESWHNLPSAPPADAAVLESLHDSRDNANNAGTSSAGDSAPGHSGRDGRAAGGR